MKFLFYSRDDSHIQLPSQFLSQSSFCENSADSLANSNSLPKQEPPSPVRPTRTSSRKAEAAPPAVVNRPGRERRPAENTAVEKEEEEEQEEISPSQSILSKMKAAELKSRKNARVETRGIKRWWLTYIIDWNYHGRS